MAAARIGPPIILASILINPRKREEGFGMMVKMIIVMRRRGRMVATIFCCKTNNTLPIVLVQSFPNCARNMTFTKLGKEAVVFYMNDVI